MGTKVTKECIKAVKIFVSFFPDTRGTNFDSRSIKNQNKRESNELFIPIITSIITIITTFIFKKLET